MDPPCENCGQPAITLDPCPCRLGIECPIRDGVCPHCWKIIRANAAGRWLWLRDIVRSPAVVL